MSILVRACEVPVGIWIRDKIHTKNRPIYENAMTGTWGSWRLLVMGCCRYIDKYIRLASRNHVTKIVLNIVSLDNSCKSYVCNCQEFSHWFCCTGLALETSNYTGLYWERTQNHYSFDNCRQLTHIRRWTRKHCCSIPWLKWFLNWHFTFY